MSNYSMAVEATETAMNSQGSAMREQEKYNQSLEARLNRLNTAWYNLSNTVGNSSMTDAIIVITNVMEGMTDAGEGTVKSLSVLPPIMGTVGLGLLLVSTRFRTMSLAAVDATRAVTASAVADGVKTATLKAQTIALSVASKAWRGFLAATGVGIAFVTIGYAIEKLTKNMSENIQKQEEFRLAQEKNVSALTDNRKETEELINTFKELNDVKEKSGGILSTEQETEYLRVQQRLAEIFPALIDNIDSTGQAHIKNSKNIEEEIRLTKEMIKKKQELILLEAKDSFKNNINKINDLKQDISNKNGKLQMNSADVRSRGNVSDATLKHMTNLEVEIASKEVEVYQSTQEIIGNIMKVANAVSILSDMDINSNLASKLEEVVSTLDFSGMDDEKVTEFAKKFGEIRVQMSEAFEAGDEQGFNNLNASLVTLLSTTNNFKQPADGLVTSFNDIVNSANLASRVLVPLDESMQDTTENIDKLAKKIDDLTNAMYERSSAEEQLANMSKSSIESSQELITLYQALSDRLVGYSDAELQSLLTKKNLTESEKFLVRTMMDREDVMKQLKVLHPQLATLQHGAIALNKEQVKAIEQENYANTVLMESYEMVMKGKYTQEQKMTVLAAEGVKSRIEEMKKEIKALQILAEAYDKMSANMMRTMDVGAMTTDPEVARFMEREKNKLSNQMSSMTADLKKAEDELNSYASKLDGFNTSLGGGVNKGTSSSSSGSKSSSDTIREATYLADKYSQLLDEIEHKLSLQSEIQSRFPSHSDDHINSIKTQLSLENDKLSVLKQQEKSLKDQLASEKFIKYGKIITESGSKKSDVINEEYVEAREEIDKAKGDLLKLQSDIAKQETQLINVQNEAIKAELSVFENRRNKIDSLLDFESTKIKEVDANSTRYAKTLALMNGLIEDKQSLNKQEMTYLNNVIYSGKAYGDTLEDAKNRVVELKTELKSLLLELQENNYEIIINIKTQFDELRGDNSYELDRYSKIQEMLTEGSADWVSVQQEKLKLQKEETRLIQEQRKALQEELKYRELTPARIKEINDALKDLSLAYWDSISAEKAYVKEMEDIQKASADKVADALIDAYKEYQQERKQEHMKMIDDELKAEQNRHQTVMDQYKSEMDLFRKNVQERSDLIDKQESDRDYNMQISELEASRSDIASEIDRLMLDDSSEARAKRKKLQEQLADIDKNISEARHKRDIDLQKEALNDMLELKEIEISEKEKMEDNLHQTVVDRIDREKEYWEKHYEDLVNDERKFAKLREDVANKNFENISKEFGGFIDHLNKTMPSLQDTMDGTMQSVGTSIRQNIIENLRTAMQLLEEFKTNQISTNGGNIGSITSSVGGSSSSKSTISGGDMKVLLGKYMYEQLAQKESDKNIQSWIYKKAQNLAEQGRTEGSKMDNSLDLNGYLSKLSKEDLSAFSAFVQANASKIVDTPHLQDYLKDFARRLLQSSARLSTGGMIPKTGSGGIDGKGGRGVVVHPEEIILNPLDTKNMLQTANVLNDIARVIAPVFSNIPQLGAVGLGGNSPISISFNVDKMYGNEQEANSFSSKIIDNLKRGFGGRI